jgi:hypothetical protein
MGYIRRALLLPNAAGYASFTVVVTHGLSRSPLNMLSSKQVQPLLGYSSDQPAK